MKEPNETHKQNYQRKKPTLYVTTDLLNCVCTLIKWENPTIKIITERSGVIAVQNTIEESPTLIICNNPSNYNYYSQSLVRLIVTFPHADATRVTRDHIYEKIGNLFPHKIPKAIRQELLKYSILRSFHIAIIYSLCKKLLTQKETKPLIPVTALYTDPQTIRSLDDPLLTKLYIWNIFKKTGNKYLNNYYELLQLVA